MQTFGVWPADTWRLEELEVGELDVPGVSHLVDDAHHRRRQFFGAVGSADGHRHIGLHAAQLLQKVDVEVGAAELAVGDALQADIFLELDDLGDRLVFDFAQPFGRDLAVRMLFAGFEQDLGAQEAADVIGAEGGGGALGHDSIVSAVEHRPAFALQADGAASVLVRSALPARSTRCSMARRAGGCSLSTC